MTFLMDVLSEMGMFVVELGLLGNTVGLMVSGGLFVAVLLLPKDIWEGLTYGEKILAPAFGLIVPLGVGLLYFATRFVKLVWAL